MSILDSVKSMLGIPAEHTAFDQQLLIHINSVFSILDQIGPGGYKVADASDTWEEYLEDKAFEIEDVKSYMYMKVRMLFDPPTTGAGIDAFKEMIKEYEWRLSVATDPIGVTS